MTNSFDLFGTLACGYDPDIQDGDQDEHIPVAEFIRLVKPDDLIVSDYYDPPKAERILREVCGLKNKLIVTNDGKQTGAVWKTISTQHHTGNSKLTDLKSPQKAGIPATLVTPSPWTGIEAFISKSGFRELAITCREARLRTYNQDFRGLEYIQTQLNFPALVLASSFLHAKAIESGIEDMLMSGRDCWLWHKLQKQICQDRYRVHYFLTSRIARHRQSASYLKYCNSLMRGKSMLVDLCGYGESLDHLSKNLSQPDCPIVICFKYNFQKFNNHSQAIVDNVPRSTIERYNMASHPMVVDVDESGRPVYQNTENIDWENNQEIQAQEAAFSACLANARFTPIAADARSLKLLCKLDQEIRLQQSRSLTGLLDKEEPHILAELEKLKL